MDQLFNKCVYEHDMMHNMWTNQTLYQHKHFKKINNMYNNLNTNEFGCTLYDIVNCLLSDYRTISNGKDIYIYIYV